MATKREIIYTVIEKVKAHSDDSDITEEFISSMVDTKRAMLLKQQFSKNGWNIPIEIKQEICISLETVDTIEGFSKAGQTVRSSISLPNRIKLKGLDGPILIRKLDGRSMHINMIPIERLPYVGSNKFTAQLTYAAIDMNGRLILFSNDNKVKFLKSLKITDIFEYPEVAFSLECDNTQSGTMEPWDMDYPVEAAMIDTIVEMIVQDLVKTLQIPEDKLNDATDGR